MSKIIDDFKIFQDSMGLAQLDPGNTSQNGALFTLEYLITLLADDSSTDEEKRNEISRIAEVLGKLEKEPGLTIRFPGSGEYESMDNTVALLTFSALFGQSKFAQRFSDRGDIRVNGCDLSQNADKNQKSYPIAKLLNLGFQPKNVWNNQNPSLYCEQGWFGRSPAMLGIIKMTTGKFCSPFLWLGVLVGQFLGCTSEPSNTDARKLAYVLWQFLKERSIFWKLAYKVWCKILLSKYPNGMKDVYSMYYRNPNHPIKVYSKAFAE